MIKFIAISLLVAAIGSQAPILNNNPETPAAQEIAAPVETPHPGPPPPLPEPLEAEEPKWEELSNAEKIALNPNNCDLNTQTLWAVDGSCHDIPAPPAPVAAQPVQQSTVSGDWVAQCHAWAAMAGMTLPPEAIHLISRESKCDPTVRNPTSSAGGIPQALPWTKMGCGLAHDDATAVCQLQWMQAYVMGVYGSWSAALNHSLTQNWY